MRLPTCQVGELEEEVAEAAPLSIECPEGVGPGDAIVVVSTEDGRELEVVVPEGVFAGMMFEVFVD